MLDINIHNYDYIIAGAGIAGLYTAYSILKHSPTARICILEASERVGGRIQTIHYDGVSIDSGGARYNTNQHRIIQLIKELELDDKQIPITNTTQYIPINPKYDTGSTNNNTNTNTNTNTNKNLISLKFPTVDSFILDVQHFIKTHHITYTELINTTVLEFANKYYSKQYPQIAEYLISINGYYSELAVLNAYEAIHLFTNEFAQSTQYYILAGGLQQITDKLQAHIKQYSNTTILLNTPLETIEELGAPSTDDNTIASSIASTSARQYIITSGRHIFHTQHIILALTQNALLQIKYLTINKNVLQMINSIKTEPLYRIYARYPNNPQTGIPWFSNLTKTITNLPIKYIIPISYNTITLDKDAKENAKHNDKHNDKETVKNIIMISYTDSIFAKYWLKTIVNNTFEKTLTKQLKLLFPNIIIPDATWYKHYYWDIGAGYWKKGYDRKNILDKIIKPLDNEQIYICGENYSSHQAWVEGALETSDLVLTQLIAGFRKSRKQIQQPTIITKHTEHTKHTKHTKKIKHTKYTKQYTLVDVAKHNTKNDAWIVVDGIVADITKWIPKHPGGNIILSGIGLDATKLFHSMGHSKNAVKQLKKYQIGVLAGTTK